MSEITRLKIDKKIFRKKAKEFYAQNDAILREIMTRMRDNKMSVGSLIEKNAIEYSEIDAVRFEDRHVTYKEFNEWVNRYAHYFLSIGVEKKDVVVVLMKNRLELLFIMGALGKIGAMGLFPAAVNDHHAMQTSFTIPVLELMCFTNECVDVHTVTRKLWTTPPFLL